MPPALASEPLAAALLPGRWKAWRAVEGQHVVSTLRLAAGDPRRQDLLERILEESKPPLPEGADGLHYLLSTPFRYPPAGAGSRFRGWGDPGVLYGAALRRTACAEVGYWRWRFVAESEGLGHLPAAAQTLFRFGAAGRGVDLEKPPLSADAARWTHPADYTATQELGRLARAAGAEWIAYRSVRDPAPGRCYAVLTGRAIRPRDPLERETWWLTVSPTGAVWQREGGERFVFRYAPV